MYLLFCFSFHLYLILFKSRKFNTLSKAKQR